MDKTEHNQLTPEEERVIVDKGTEAPFSGSLNDHFASGVYQCKRCNALLYWSKDKFQSHCGWPCFDDEIPGAVKRSPDPDHSRSEISCSGCGAHLGHVFSGEGYTAKNLRHCVNSVSLNFVPTDQIKTGRAIFAGGCFWGVEYYFKKQPGVLKVTSGYTGGSTANPTYKQVCSGKTGHLEAVEVIYDPARTGYEALAKLFFEIHDPTQADGQGPDLGEQYRSAVFYQDDEQKNIATKLISQLEAKGLKIATEIKPAAKFWPAETYHQDYYAKQGGTPYCHKYTKRFD